MLYLSVVVPVYNEEENIEPLYTAIVDSLASAGFRYEIILVDDGSRDDTVKVAAAIAAGDPALKVVRFRRNFGQTPAMAAGIDCAQGDVIVTMDGDLQNDPKDIVTLVEHIEAGADLAVGWRFRRQDKLITRKIPSVIANWIIGKVTGVPIKDNGCSLKAYRADVIKRVPLYSEMHRFIPAMSSIAGAKIVEVKVRHHARQHGESKYGLSRVYKVLFDLLTIKTITAFAANGLKWFSGLAIPFGVAALSSLVWSLRLAFDADNSLVVAVGTAAIFMSGFAFLLVCGVLSELIYKTGDIRPMDFFSSRAMTAKSASASSQTENGLVGR
jgi:glycosyltransferase involved in cell wall biosynthesis